MRGYRCKYNSKSYKLFLKILLVIYCTLKDLGDCATTNQPDVLKALLCSRSFVCRNALSDHHLLKTQFKDGVDLRA